MTTPVNPLLLSQRAVTLQTEPFFYLEIDNFLPQDVYEEALAAFPPRDWFPEVTQGNKLRFASTRSPELVTKLVDASPAWRKLLGWLKAEAFLNDLYTYTHQGLTSSRGRWGARPWIFEPARNFVESMTRVEVSAEFEFSRLEPGAFVPAHTDNPTKLVSALLYFPDPAWQPGFGGDTVYYRGKNGKSVANWHNSRLNLEDLEPLHVNRFAPNRLALFLKSAHSHHAVSAIACPEGMARNSLNFNVYAKVGRMERRLSRTKMRATTKLSKLRERIAL